MAFPLLAVGARLLGGAARKVAGKALRWATKGRLIGSGGGRELAKRAGQAAGAIATVAAARPVLRSLPMPGRATTTTDWTPEMIENYRAERMALGGGGGGRRYRRINPANGRALRRAMRRLDAAEKIFKKVFRFNHGKAPTNVRLRGK